MRHLILSICIAATFVSSAEAKGRHRPKVPVQPSSSESFIVATKDGTIVREQKSDIIRPIASISKLMVGLLVSKQDLNESLSIPSTREVNSVIPRKTNSLTRYELLTLALVRSDNFAAQILCSNLTNCVENMNKKAAELGMTDTHYEEPTGLSEGNVSTANDLLKLLIVASKNNTLTEISSQSIAEISTNNRLIKIHNTNPLTAKFDIILSKTGFTNPAGGCLVMILNSDIGQHIYILLGSKNAHTRIPDMERLVKES